MSLYDELNVAEDATQDELREGYKRAVNKAHPDKGGSHEKFVAVKKAYEILSNPETRAHYDKYGSVPDDKPKINYQELAETEIINVIMFVSEQVDSVYNDIVEHSKSLVTNSINHTKAEIKSYRKMSKKYKNIYNRLTSKSGNTIVINNMRLKRLSTLHQIKACLHKLRVSAIIIELLDDYNYRTDVKPTVQYNNFGYMVHG